MFSSEVSDKTKRHLAVHTFDLGYIIVHVEFHIFL